MGATYGNLFSDLESRNLIYWKTVYVFFFSAIVFNKNNGIEYILFTNIKDFPFRKEIEGMGVIIYDNLELTKRNKCKWATVNFFFDVINFILKSNLFLKDDRFILLDTDVVSCDSAKTIFKSLDNSIRPIAYISKNIFSNDEVFHDLKISNLEEIAFQIFGTRLKIKDLIGGEFFSFSKRQAFSFQNEFSTIRSSIYSKNIYTEEHVLTLYHAYKNFNTIPRAIFRVWTTIKFLKMPFKNIKYIFLHFPSEKDAGLTKLFNAVYRENPCMINESEFQRFFYRSLPINNPYKFYLNRIFMKFKSLRG